MDIDNITDHFEELKRIKEQERKDLEANNNMAKKERTELV